MSRSDVFGRQYVVRSGTGLSNMDMGAKAGAHCVILTFSGNVMPAASLTLRESFQMRLAWRVTSGPFIQFLSHSRHENFFLKRDNKLTGSKVFKG